MDFILYFAYMVIGLAVAFGLNLLVIVLIGRSFARKDRTR